MPHLMATHEVDDVDHWLASPKREEAFAGVGRDIRTFVDPDRPGFVGLTMTVDDMAAFGALMEGPVAAEAMKHDGVRPETLRIYIGS